MSVREMQRMLESHERRFNDYVRKAEHDIIMRNVETDVADIKDSQKWMQRLLVGNFVTLLVALILFLLERSAA